ncbi:DUF1800 family protein [Opacimonas viscosa]|uniref:DUF1800 family protein n=1 Tax=Opacimonas viscosa TaxID=2961944 RepID=A0AA41X3Z4_9ALTE|nr:DUF1800 family protein [Opacimonas viscosa]MCP3429066.1 DUF1800 family protein [Opacimonas viscosa]
MQFNRVVLMGVSFLFITACGGGGSSSTPAPAPNPTITQPSNNAPTAANTSLTIDEDTTGAGAINASDADGDTLSYSVTSGTQNGQLTLNANGTFNYTPNAGFFGSDTATISVSDGTDTVTLTLAITVNEVIENSAPTAAITLSRMDVVASEPLQLSAEQSTDPDNGDTLSYQWSLTSPNYSQASIDNPTNSVIEIRPDAIGEYTLSLTVTDSSGATDTANMSFTPGMPEPMALPNFAPSPPPAGFINHTVDAVRLLKQATFGPTVESVARLEELGGEAWFQEQMSLPQTKWVDLREIIEAETGDIDGVSENGKEWIQEIFNMTAFDAEDQLRHRIAYTLSQLFVVSTQTDLGHKDSAFTTYWDRLATHATGNFRDLLEDVTLHPTMGHYLNMIGNQKADPSRNIRPDENFAREVMQLFTIGLAELNQDGSVKLDETGEPIETYNQQTIQNYAAALTGWYYMAPEIESNGRENYHNFGCSIHCFPNSVAGTDMVAYQHIHQKTEKQLLRGYYIPPGQTAEQDLAIVMDSLFYHPNLGPFFAQHLIRQMVTSNPTPGYIERVSAVFNNNGNGVRGDIAATVKAVLFDSEARNPESVDTSLYGKLKEPVLKKTHFIRLFDIQLLSEPQVSLDNLWGSNIWCPLGCAHTQKALDSDSVFNFFRPDFAPNGDIAGMGLVAPEAQILTESNVVSEVQMTRWIKSPLTWEQQVSSGLPREWHATGFDPDPLISVWDENGFEGVIDFLNLYLLAGGMTEEYRRTLLDIQTIQNYQHVFDGQDPAWDSSSSDLLERHQFLIDLIYMVMSSSEFRIQQ